MAILIIIRDPRPPLPPVPPRRNSRSLCHKQPSRL